MPHFLEVSCSRFKMFHSLSSQVTVYAQLCKRLRNVRSPIKSRAPAKKLCLGTSVLSEEEFGSSDSTVLLDTSDTTDDSFLDVGGSKGEF